MKDENRMIVWWRKTENVLDDIHQSKKDEKILYDEWENTVGIDEG